MFAKLLKHEWRNTAGLLGLLSLAALGLGVLGTVILRILVTNADQMLNSDSPLQILFFVLVMMLVFLYIALIAYAVGSYLLLLYRFYKNKFTDEGYLTFTLPVNCHQIFLASLVNMVIWMLIVVAVVFGVIFIVALFGTATEGLVNMEVLTALQEAFSQPFMMYEGTKFMMLLIGLEMIVAILTAPVLPMTCITIGAVLAKKHKLLTAFGIYYGVTFGISVISTVLMSVITLVQFAVDENILIHNIFTLPILLQLCFAVGGYFLSTYLMRKKLNLP